MSLASLAPREDPSAAERADVPAAVGGSAARIRVLRAAMIAGLAMCVCEGAKDLFLRNLEPVTSLAITVVLTALVVMATSFAVLRREERLLLELAANEMRYRLLFWKSLTGAYRATLDGVILDCNVAFCRILGYAAREELVGKSIDAAYFSPADRAAFIERLQAQQELTNFEQRLRRKDGSAVWVLVSAALVADELGEGLVIKGTITDVTERVKTQQESRVLADIVRCSDDAIFSITRDGVIETWNGGAERTYGYSAAEVIGRPVHVLVPLDRAHESDRILEQVRSGREVKNLELVRLRNDGRQIVIHLTVSPTRDASGSVIGASAIARDVTEERRSEATLRQSEEQYRILFEGNPVAMYVYERRTLRILAVNKAAIQQYGFTEQEFLEKTVAEFRPGEDIPSLLQDMAAHTDGLQKRGLWRHRRKDGAILDVEIVCHPLNFRGTESVLIAAHDITERKRAEESLRQAEEKYRGIFEDSVIGIFQATMDRRLVSINRTLAHMHGYDSAEEMMEDISRRSPQLFVDPSRMTEMAQVVVEGGTVRGAELEIYRRDGTTKWVRMNLRGIRDASGQVVLREGTVEDITEYKAAAERIKFLAYYDALTELPQRALLQDRLEHALAGARRRHEKIALLFLDLDRFKSVNDSFGHSFGDIVLKAVSQRLKACAREQDTVARVGGDEFLILLGGVKDAADAAIAAERIMSAMNASIVLQGHSVDVGCSIGLSMYPEHGMDGETLIKNADAAMYCAKEAGRGNVRFFTDEMNAQAVERLAMDKNLRLALDRDEFFLVYQPQMEIESGKITGFEALIRWQHPEMGLVPPDRFIPVAENNGLILPIGEWVLRTACTQARTWLEAGLPAVPVAVNVSAVQFRQESFCAIIRRVLQETRLPPQYLELELTESFLMSNADETLYVLRELKAMGIKLAIDDFGTGYSSLSYLRQFPVDKLKIDKSFIRDAVEDCSDGAITTAIISMTKSLRLKVIAEGVENEAQLFFLREHRCDEIQGYYFSRPLSVGEATARLQRAQDEQLAAGEGDAFYALRSGALRQDEDAGSACGPDGWPPAVGVLRSPAAG
jgi:diguanylate cyclase (GGDEF)-like protein/PAS domain S-box-containing protein